MPSMSITIERTPLTLQWEGQDIQVEQLGIRLPFARKPENLGDMSASGDYIVYVTETRTMTPEEFDGFAANLLVSRDWLAGKGEQLEVCKQMLTELQSYDTLDLAMLSRGCARWVII